MSDERPKDARNDREGQFRVPGPLYDRWLRRCHREGVDPDKAACVWLERGLRRGLALMSEDSNAVELEAEQEDETDG